MKRDIKKEVKNILSSVNRTIRWMTIKRKVCAIGTMFLGILFILISLVPVAIFILITWSILHFICKWW